MHWATQRLILRPWCADDAAPFAAMSADPEVMRFFPSTLSAAEAAAQVAGENALFADQGLGVLPVTLRDTGAFLGCVGLHPIRPGQPPGPGVEIVWRLARSAWGQGYAPEAAQAWLDYGFSTLKLAEVVAFTAEINLPSQAVMRKLGMRGAPDKDFDHPALPEGDRLRPHLVYVAP